MCQREFDSHAASRSHTWALIALPTVRYGTGATVRLAVSVHTCQVGATSAHVRFVCRADAQRGADNHADDDAERHQRDTARHYAASSCFVAYSSASRARKPFTKASSRISRNRGSTSSSAHHLSKSTAHVISRSWTGNFIAASPGTPRAASATGGGTGSSGRVRRRGAPLPSTLAWLPVVRRRGRSNSRGCRSSLALRLPGRPA